MVSERNSASSSVPMVGIGVNEMNGAPSVMPIEGIVPHGWSQWEKRCQIHGSWDTLLSVSMLQFSRTQPLLLLCIQWIPAMCDFCNVPFQCRSLPMASNKA